VPRHRQQKWVPVKREEVRLLNRPHRRRPRHVVQERDLPS
jgi:hypothetical protein